LLGVGGKGYQKGKIVQSPKKKRRAKRVNFFFRREDGLQA